MNSGILAEVMPKNPSRLLIARNVNIFSTFTVDMKRWHKNGVYIRRISGLFTVLLFLITAHSDINNSACKSLKAELHSAVIKSIYELCKCGM